MSSTPAARPASTRRAAVATSLAALAVALPACLVAAFFWVATATSTSEDPLVALGYLVAVFFGVPGVLGVILGGLGWRLADRAAGLVLGILGDVVTGAMLLVMLVLSLPQF